MRCDQCSKINTKNFYKKTQLEHCPKCEPQSNSKLKIDLEMCFNEINQLKQKVSESRETKLKLNLSKVNTLRDEINNKANQIISSIQKKQMKLLTETKNIELHLRKKFNIGNTDLEIENKTLEAKLSLQKNDQKVFLNLMDDLLRLKPQLDAQINQIEKLNDDEYEFVSKLSTETDTCDFGEIITKRGVRHLVLTNNHKTNQLNFILFINRVSQGRTGEVI